ncbi:MULTISPECIES: PspA-associated protein PspAA [Kitasatospora]|uniref:PspA-associated domain-containing protein n=1 Tax=Kitasatospora cystarginea TaxID=58350 RepID=A0ABP5QTH6_9ACTN
MIVRILGEGQYSVAEGHLDELNRLDARLQSAVEAQDEKGFAGALRALLETVRRLGAPLTPDSLVPSELVLPDEDMSLAEVSALLTDESLIPG